MSGKHASLLSKIAQKESPADEVQIREGIKIETQARTHPTMLVVFLKNGDEQLLSYNLFRRAFKRDGGRTWELVFDDCSVIVTGRNLNGKALRDAFQMQRLKHLCEGNLIEDDLAEDGDVFIESIEIREKEEA